VEPNGLNQIGTHIFKPHKFVPPIPKEQNRVCSLRSHSAPDSERTESGLLTSFAQCPREESNFRTWFRKPLLYPLSYEGVSSKYTRIL
jgi:hypothetical protein